MRLLGLLLTAGSLSGQWVSLFDGKTTDGWLEITGDAFPRQSWTIEDGCLKAVPNPDGFQDIRTVATFRSFELEFAWRISAGGNSGVKYLIHKVDKWQSKTGKGYQARARGFEYQLVDDATNDDAKKDPRHRAGALYSRVAPSQAAARPAGEFNQSRLVVRGRHIEQWLNGVKVVELEAEERELRESPISLQNHASEVWFRNLRIRRLE